MWEARWKRSPARQLLCRYLGGQAALEAGRGRGQGGQRGGGSHLPGAAPGRPRRLTMRLFFFLRCLAAPSAPPS